MDRPVLFITPMIMPAVAQAMVMGTTSLAPDSRAFSIFVSVIRLPFFIKIRLTRIKEAIA